MLNEALKYKKRLFLKDYELSVSICNVIYVNIIIYTET